MRIAVLGGGCVGLTTALQLSEELRGATRLDVLGADFERTTSHVAAGIFRVGTAYAGPTEAVTRFPMALIIALHIYAHTMSFIAFYLARGNCREY